MKYIAKGEHNRDFELFDEAGSSLGRVAYTSWFSMNVDIVTPKQTYEVGAANFWHTSLQVTIKDTDTVIAKLKFNWMGNMVLEMTEGKSYLFKPNFWHNKYTLYTQEEKGIITLQPDFQWAKFSFNYEIETDDNYDEAKDHSLLLLLIYCCNHIHTRSFVATA